MFLRFSSVLYASLFSLVSTFLLVLGVSNVFWVLHLPPGARLQDQLGPHHLGVACSFGFLQPVNGGGKCGQTHTAEYSVPSTVMFAGLLINTVKCL